MFSSVIANSTFKTIDFLTGFDFLQMIPGTSGQNAFAITTYPTSKLVYGTESLSVADCVLTKLHAVILLSLVIVAVKLPVSEVKALTSIASPPGFEITNLSLISKKEKLK